MHKKPTISLSNFYKWRFFMAQALFTGYLETGLNHVATAVNTVGAGARGWLKNSDVTWISTAVVYGATKVAADQKWIAGMNPNHAAALVFIVSSIHAIANGVLPTNENDVAMNEWANRSWIVITNTAAASLAATSRLGLDMADYKTAVVAVAVGALARKIYLNQTTFTEYFKAGVDHATTAAGKVKAGVSTMASAVKDAGFGSWLAKSDITWASTAVAYFLTKLAINEKWISGVNPTHAAAFMFVAASTSAIAQAIIPSTLPNKNLIQAANAVAAPLLAAHYFKWNVNYTTGLAAAAVYGVVEMAHKSFYSKT